MAVALTLCSTNSSIAIAQSNVTVTVNGSVTEATCSATGVTISFGDVATTALPSVGSVTSTSSPQNIQLSCTNNPSVDMKLTTAPIAGTTNVLPVTGGAQGVGVQLIYSANPMVYNQSYHISDAAAATVNIPIAARYYRVGDLVVGDANVSATIQFTYQ